MTPDTPHPSPDETPQPPPRPEAAFEGPLDLSAFDSAAEDADGADLAEQLAREKDRGLRLQAEMQNLRNRTARELADERRYAPLPLIRDILPVLDNMDRAIEAAEQKKDTESLLEGFRLVRQQLVSVLEQHHCEPVEAAGQPFDPAFHEAILQQPSGEHPAGSVMLVTQSGYRLHDRVVRPAQVIVSSGSDRE